MSDVLILTLNGKPTLACVSGEDLSEYWEEDDELAKWTKTFDSLEDLIGFLRGQGEA